ncbi:hypothetical protein [Streptomyces halobius]|uniref:Uncharacterized protein n=1 Tax=Streptomyces halobius TaxID=2879846 RepID=A0ABY4MKZ9_9ACTN|nr:hypothetical protein [Streptomyces halobius]UQA97106.1 hypothetical protein K9S39_39255 [Streptomyces halobius]
MAEPMAADDILRACGYLEAVWMEDATNMAALLNHRTGEIPTAILVTELGESFMQQALPAQFGVHDDMTPQELQDATEKMTADPTVRVSKVLIEALKEIAPTATPPQAETIARALITYLLAISDATQDDVMPMLTALRQSALQRYGGQGT